VLDVLVVAARRSAHQCQFHASFEKCVARVLYKKDDGGLAHALLGPTSSKRSPHRRPARGRRVEDTTPGDHASQQLGPLLVGSDDQVRTIHTTVHATLLTRVFVCFSTPRRFGKTFRCA